MQNLHGGAAVTLRLRGKDVPGTAAPSADEAAAQQLLQRMYPRLNAAQAAEMCLIDVRL